MGNQFVFKCFVAVVLAVLFYQCEVLETCSPSCASPDFTTFVFDTTSIGFSPAEIDSFYIVRFPLGELDTPLDTSALFVKQNPFYINSGLFSTPTLDHDYVVEGINQEFRFEITELDYTIKSNSDQCGCDVVENKSLRINGILTAVPDPFQPVLLQK